MSEEQELEVMVDGKPVEVKKTQCEYIFKNGKKAGKRCEVTVRSVGQTLCNVHRGSKGVPKVSTAKEGTFSVHKGQMVLQDDTKIKSEPIPIPDNVKEEIDQVGDQTCGKKEPRVVQLVIDQSESVSSDSTSDSSSE